MSNQTQSKRGRKYDRMGGPAKFQAPSITEGTRWSEHSIGSSGTRY